jgi:gas vesicle protein
MHKVPVFLKGMATGLVVGAAVTMIADPMSDRERHKIAKKTEGIFKNIGSVIDTTLGMMR